MFKRTIPTIVISGLLAAPVYAAETPANFFFKPYLGADYQYVGVNYDDIPGTSFNYGDIAEESLHGVNVHVGARVHKHLGFEAGYLWTGDGDKTLPGGTTSVNVRGFTLDALGYLPLDEAKRVELIGTIGISHLKGDATGTVTGIGTASVDESETKPRFGGGAQYWLTDNLNVRGLVRYQGADFDGVVKNAVIANLGLNFQF